MKKILALLLCFILVLSVSSCRNPSPSGSSQTQLPDSAPEKTDGSSDSSDSSDVSPENTVLQYDPDLEHKIILDDSSNKILVIDLNAMGDISDLECLEDAIIWEWDSRTAPGCVLGKGKSNVDEANIRYSAYWERDVVIACGSGGWVGVIDYATKEVLFEDFPGTGPHSVEMMPNGDLVLACSGNSNADVGRLLYYPLSAGETEPSHSTDLYSAHGVCYDPEKDCLWALGGKEVRAYLIDGYGTVDAEFRQIMGEGASLTEVEDAGGHDLSPVYGEPGKYWVSSGKKVWLFDSEAGTLSGTYKYSSQIVNRGVKGIAYFADGTMVQSGSVGAGGSPEYMSTALRVITLEMSAGKVQRLQANVSEIPHADERQTYKVHTFTKDYQ